MFDLGGLDLGNTFWQIHRETGSIWGGRLKKLYMSLGPRKDTLCQHFFMQNLMVIHMKTEMLVVVENVL